MLLKIIIFLYVPKTNSYNCTSHSGNLEVSIYMLLFQPYMVYNWLWKIPAQLKEVADRKLRISSKTQHAKQRLILSLFYTSFCQVFHFFYHNMQKKNLKVN